MDTLAFGYILPTTGRIRDFNPLEMCAARRTMKKVYRNVLFSSRFDTLFYFTNLPYDLPSHFPARNLRLRKSSFLHRFLTQGQYHVAMQKIDDSST